MNNNERKMVLSFKAPNIACSLVQAYSQFESWTGWIVKLGLFNAGGVNILCIRERAAGEYYKEIMNTVGTAYANHSIYYILTDAEVKDLQSLFGDFTDSDSFRIRFQKFIENITTKAHEPDKLGNGKIYASTIYDSNNLELCHAITDPQWTQQDLYDKLWSLWAYTSGKETRKRSRALKRALK